MNVPNLLITLFLSPFIAFSGASSWQQRSSKRGLTANGPTERNRQDSKQHTFVDTGLQIGNQVGLIKYSNFLKLMVFSDSEVETLCNNSRSASPAPVQNGETNPCNPFAEEEEDTITDDADYVMAKSNCSTLDVESTNPSNTCE